jgi:hypothetical protein
MFFTFFRCSVLTYSASYVKLPAMYDSNGVLSILDRFRRPTQARWVPALDTNTLARRKGKEESYWPVGVSEKEMWCIILKVRVFRVDSVKRVDDLSMICRARRVILDSRDL